METGRSELILLLEDSRRSDPRSAVPEAPTLQAGLLSVGSFRSLGWFPE